MSLKVWVAAKLVQLAEWAAWKAWNYARKRALSRESWFPEEAKDARGEDTPDQRRIKGEEARHVLENRHFVAAWNALNAHLEAQTLGCDPDDKDKAARVVIAKQLLHALRREFIRKLDDGYMAEVELDELQRRRRPVRIVR